MKKIIKVFLFLFTCIILVACEDIVEKRTSDDIYNNIEISLAEGDTNNSVTKDFTVTTVVYNNYIITWKSNDEAITINESNAFVTRDTNDVLVELVASFTFNSLEYEKVFELKVLKVEIIEPKEPTIEDIKNGIDIELSTGDTILSVTKNIILTNNILDYEISWYSNNNAITINNENSLAIVVRGESDLEVNLTAKFIFNELIK